MKMTENEQREQRADELGLKQAKTSKGGKEQMNGSIASNKQAKGKENGRVGLKTSGK